MIDWRSGRFWIGAASLASLLVSLVHYTDLGWGKVLAGCNQPDTATYYYAVLEALAGRDPYDPAGLASAFGGFLSRWVYPPTALPFFMPLAGLSLGAAMNVFDLVKLLAMLGLVAVWCQLWPQLRRDWAFWLFAVVALNRTFLQDWCSGNIAIFESLAIWSAVLLILRQRYLGAVVLIALLSLIKPTWLVLLGLFVLMAPGRLSWRIALGGAAVGAGLLVLWFALDPASFYAWVNNAISTLQIRYNLFEFAKDMSLRLGGELKAPLWQRPEYALYLAWILAVGWLLWRNWRAGTTPLLAGSLLILAVPAAGPANLSYSWVVAVPLVYLAVMQAEGPWRWIIAALAIMPPPLAALLMHVHILAMLPLLSVMLAFLVLALQTPHRRLSLQTID